MRLLACVYVCVCVNMMKIFTPNSLHSPTHAHQEKYQITFSVSMRLFVELKVWRNTQTNYQLKFQGKRICSSSSRFGGLFNRWSFRELLRHWGVFIVLMSALIRHALLFLLLWLMVSMFQRPERNKSVLWKTQRETDKEDLYIANQNGKVSFWKSNIGNHKKQHLSCISFQKLK